MSEELAKSYEPRDVEHKWYRYWEEHGCFNADPNSSKPSYSIVIPPPNVTGVLHMGHALVDTLQDVLIRWKRMSGFEALWVPGTDHAGIATQTVVERNLIKALGKRRVDFSREEFLQHIWAWKEESQTHILTQLKKLGCSCDWSRLAFTMDEERNLAVRTMFKKMFDDQLIYRGDYLVNWDPVTQTALADDEVEHEERQSHLWHIRYPLADGSGFIVIATTRPETLLGDTAVAVSPHDPRYQHLVGKQVLLPIQNRLIPIIADPHIDSAFGTGAMKVTPAHDFNDYEIGQRHKLPLRSIMTSDGSLNELGAPFQGLKMEAAREAVVKNLKELGLLEKTTSHVSRIGISYRSKAVIEPHLSKQWFIRMSRFKQELLSAVKEKRVKLIPEHWGSTYFHWIENLRDWCISRQLWWGHRIPIWYNGDRMICYSGEGAPPEVMADPEGWKQDEDVLDTWFSSALWPFSVLGWPNQTPDLKKFYPTSVLVTGHDILFFWVARMIMMGEYALGKPPFPESFLHGLIYGKSYWKNTDQGAVSYIVGSERLEYDLGKSLPKDVLFKWEKMSKSKGNIIDPLEIIDAYGTDALRMALCASATHAPQIDLDRRKFEEFKNFANKVWNGARFVFMHLESAQIGGFINTSALEDQWIFSILNRTIDDVTHHLESYAFDKAAMAAYDFFWKEFCAYYVEISKPVLFGKTGSSQDKCNKQNILFVVLCSAIRLLHPMAPFITEELFQHLRKIVVHKTTDSYLSETIAALKHPSIMKAPYPRPIERPSDAVETSFKEVDAVLHAIRNIRAEMQINPGTATDVVIVGKTSLLFENEHILKALLRINALRFEEEEPELSLAASQSLGAIKIIVPLPEELKEKEKQRLAKEREKLLLQKEQLEKQLSNDDFVSKAPAHVVEKLKAQLQIILQNISQ